MSSLGTVGRGHVILGGLADSHDIAPSIVFEVVHLLLFGRALQQLISVKKHYGKISGPQVRFLAFEIVRVVTFILRIVWAATSSTLNTNLIIANVAFMSTGVLILAFACIDLVQDIVHRKHPELNRKQLRKIMPHLKILRPLLGTAIILNIVGVSIGSSNPSESVSIRQAASYILDALLLIHFIGILRTRQLHGMDHLPFVLIILATIFVAIPAIYKTIQTYSDSYTDQINTKIVFYCVYVLPELIAAMILIIPDTYKIFSAPVVKTDVETAHDKVSPETTEPDS